MAESNNAWGAFADEADELRQAWDSYDPLPEPGENLILDQFCDNKNIDIPSLLRLGAKLAESDTLAFGYDNGIKYRNMNSGKMWSYIGSEYPHLKIVRAGAEPSERVIVCEGETDGARLTGVYNVDVAVMPAGARNFPRTMAKQLEDYEQVLIGLDQDEAGEDGASKIRETHSNTVRFVPDGEGDWCDHERLPALPEYERRERQSLSIETLVPASVMLNMDVPEVSSWLEQAVLPVAETLIIHGWAKSFKTFLALDMVTRLAQGQDWCGFEPTEEPCKVAIMQFELVWPYYHARMQKLHATAPEPQLFEQNVFTWTPTVRPELTAGDSKQEDKILHTLSKAGIQIILIDPIRRAVGLADLNAESEVRKMLNFFSRLNDEGITVVATHHDNKEGAKAGGGSNVNMTGSGAFAGDPGTIVSVELPRGEDLSTGTRRNLHFTLRYGPAIGPRSMEIREDGQIVYDNQPVLGGGESEQVDGPPPPSI